MATIVLTALGTAIGGPFGGALGALAGQAIDATIFKPAGRTGPRLNDLQIQTSRYGARIPRLYGTIRVAGTVIWSTDLQESSKTEGGGKGQPSITSYNYSASFAVALSARRISGIGRIWADGNLLRGVAGDFKSPVGAFRIHVGREDQPVDPLIAADVGMDHAPAFRGCAYAVFDGLQLADFGNRIPSLTFEVIADAGSVGLAAIASDLAGEQIAYIGDAEEPLLSGFAGDGSDLGDATAALIDVHDLLWREENGSLALTAGKATAETIHHDRTIHAIDGGTETLDIKQKSPIETVPARLSIRHHDPARDFQVGVQTAERPGPGMRSETVDLPAVLSAEYARQLADRKLRTALRRRSLIRRAVGWAALDHEVGDVVTLAEEPGRWLIEAKDWENMVVRFTLRAYDGASRPTVAAGEPGTPVLQQDAVQGPTSLAIVELPPDGSTLATTPAIYVAATGADAGWRRAALLRYRADLETAEPIGRTAPRAVLGVTMDALPHSEPWRIDRRSTVDIQLDNAADALISVEDSLLLGNANLCLIGEEVLQFGSAEPIGPQRYRLSRLIRGWHGTEWASASHVVGERFVLLDPARLAPIQLLPADVGQSLDVRAVGSGDFAPAEAVHRIDGRTIVPPSPVHGRIAPSGGGDLHISWTRRSRLGWTWGDQGDAPLGEERESYNVRTTANGLVLRTWGIADAFVTYPASQIVADRIAAGPWPLQMEIRQSGTMGVSKPLLLDLPERHCIHSHILEDGPVTQTNRLALPLLAAGQAQKEVTHNEALCLLDAIVQLTVESADHALPPAMPANGQCWIVAAGATGDWSGRDGMVAAWTANGWIFASPGVGWQAWVADRGNLVRFGGTGWIDDPIRNGGFYVDGLRILSERQAAIAGPSGGATQDNEARAVIEAILNALRAHGIIEA